MSESTALIFKADHRYSLWLPPNKGSVRRRSAGTWLCEETDGERHKFSCPGATCVYYTDDLDMALTHESIVEDNHTGCVGCESGGDTGGE